jgi:serine/threonine-protein kinase RsbW
LEIEAHLTASVTVPGEVRALIRRLRGDLSATVYDNARLLASEVATNAVLYGAPGAPIYFHAELHDKGLRIQIRNDRGAGRPVVAAGEREHGGGWGLRLVDAIAQRWGSSESDAHTFVWFELEPASR